MVKQTNWFPVFAVGLMAWLIVGYLVHDVHPRSTAIVSFWLACLFMAFWATAFFLTHRLRRSLLLAMAASGYLWLRLNTIDTPLNVIFFLGIVIGLEFFLTTK